jgi:tRNA dimethylallyltransferase
MVALVSAPSPLLVVLLGATGSGKSALAVLMAQQLGGEVVSCDSVAVYRGLEIGAAKPTHLQRAAIPHHLLDVVAPDETFSAGDYSRAARAALADITARGRVPIVAGGTGLYLRALLQGLFAGPQRDEALRERLRDTATARGAHYVHRLLRKLDSATAALIHPKDVPKVLRALEVRLTLGSPMTQAWAAGSDPLRGYRVVKIGLEPDRPRLYERINARAGAMFAAGLVEETRALVAQYGADCWPLQSLGYRQAQAVLRGEMTEPEAIAATAQGHRNYAKRQGTWFRREKDVHWLRGFGEDIADKARQIALESS